MRVLLLNPRTDNMISTELPGYVAREVGVFPPLGLLYVAAYLRAHSGHAVRLLDMPAENCSYEELAERLRRDKPDLVGITGTTHNLLEVRRAADCVKAVLPGTAVCLGGPHVDAFPEESLALASIDFACRGEGEQMFLALANALAGNGGREAIPGLIYRQDGRVVRNPPEEPTADLDSLPFPARDLVDPGRYYYVLGRPAAFTTLVSSRGCPFRCVFCSTPHGKHRARSARNTVDEMEACLGSGAKEFHFVDDTINVIAGRLTAISEEILRRQLDVSWSCRARVGDLGLADLRVAKRSGCTRIHFGIETGTDEGLRQLRKGISTEQVRQAVAWARAAGISTAAYFLIGCPHEKTRRDVMQTVDFACKINPDFAMFNILAIYPKTELFEMGIRKGLIEADTWRNFARDPRPGFQVRLWEEHFNRRELGRLAHAAYRRFYLRPSLLLRNLRQTASWADLRRKLLAASGIIFGSRA